MAKSIGKSAQRVFAVLLSLSLAVAGACLIGGCLYIYYAGNGYSRELVVSVFSKIAVPVYIAIGLTVIGFIWELFAPHDAEYHKASKAYAAALERLYATRNANDPDIVAEQKRRKVLSVVRTVLVLAGLAVFFGYAVQPSHYTEDINASVIRAMWVAIPCFVVPFAFAIVAAYATDKSYQREIALLKKQPRIIEDLSITPPDTKKRGTAVAVLRTMLLVLALAALIYGFVAGGTVDVLTKAINICTECIGLG